MKNGIRFVAVCLITLAATFLNERTGLCEENVEWLIKPKLRELVNSSTGAWRFRCHVEGGGDNVDWPSMRLFSMCIDNAKAGQFFYLVDFDGDKVYIIGAVKVASVDSDKSLPIGMYFQILDGSDKQAILNANNLNILSAQSLQLLKEQRIRTGAGVTITPNFWLAMLYSPYSQDKITGYLYGLSATAQYKSTSFAADLIFDFLERQIQEKSGLNKEALTSSLYLRGKFQQLFSEDYALRSAIMYGKFYGDNGQKSKWFFGDLLLGKRWSDRIITGFGYRYIDSYIPAGISYSGATHYRQHTGVIGMWDAAVTGYGQKDAFDWGMDVTFLVGGAKAENGSKWLPAWGAEGFLFVSYLSDYFVARLGYRVFGEQIGKDSDMKAVNDRPDEFRFLMHGPYLDLGLFLGW